MTSSSSKPSPRRGRPPKGAVQLTRDAVIEATVAVIDAEGTGAVSMRSVARVLGVDPKSLYNHVAGKDDLLDAVAEHILDGIALTEPTGDIRADLTAIAHAFRDRAMAHPEAASLVLTRQLASLAGLAPIESVLRILRGAGCPPGEAAHLLRAMVATLIGSLLREASAGLTFGLIDKTAIANRTATLTQAGLPAIADAAPYLASFDARAEYLYAVEFALDAVMARLAAQAR